MAVLEILGSILGKVAADEIKAWLPILSDRLVEIAVQRLPMEQRERYMEEWQADLLECPGGVTKCLRALGMYWAGIRISKIGRKTLKMVIAEKLVEWILRLFVWKMLILARRLRIQMERHNAEQALATKAKPASESSVERSHP